MDRERREGGTEGGREGGRDRKVESRQDVAKIAESSPQNADKYGRARVFHLGAPWAN